MTIMQLMLKKVTTFIRYHKAIDLHGNLFLVINIICDIV